MDETKNYKSELQVAVITAVITGVAVILAGMFSGFFVRNDKIELENNKLKQSLEDSRSLAESRLRIIKSNEEIYNLQRDSVVSLIDSIGNIKSQLVSLIADTTTYRRLINKLENEIRADSIIIDKYAGFQVEKYVDIKGDNDKLSLNYSVLFNENKRLIGQLELLRDSIFTYKEHIEKCNPIVLPDIALNKIGSSVAILKKQTEVVGEGIIITCNYINKEKKYASIKYELPVQSKKKTKIVNLKVGKLNAARFKMGNFYYRIILEGFQNKKALFSLYKELDDTSASKL